MRNLLTALLLMSVASFAPAQQPPGVEEKGPYLGVLFSPIPEALLDHLPQLPREGGVLVTHILPDSPAFKAGLKKHDILLQFDTEKVRDGNHLARLIQSSKTGQAVKLLLMRAGRELTLEAKIDLGPVLRIAKEEGTKAPGVAKPGGPAEVSVSAVPMEGNRLKVTFEYSEAGRIRSITCAGGPAEIDRELDKLPDSVQKLAREAVQKLRALNLQVPEIKKPG